MKRLIVTLMFGLTAVAAQAEAPFAVEGGGSSPTGELPAYLQCVPFARQISGIQIYGDAWTWWEKAAGRYSRGHSPRLGAVMAFRPHGNMTLGHVAAVSRVVDPRTVLLTHANWSLIDGRRGQVEHDVRAVDVSPANDWSEVRVWYAPRGDLGTTAWPVEGFIYPQGPSARAWAQAPVAAIASPKPRRDVIAEIIRAAG